MGNLKDVAALAGVSVSTASRVLGNKSYVSEKTRKSVLAAAEQLNYHPNTIAKSLKARQTKTIALLIPNIENLYLPMIVRGVQDTAHDYGYTVVLCNTHDDPETEREYIDIMRGRWIDGFIISSMRQNSEHVRRLSEDGFPIVLTSRHYGDAIDTVAIDNVHSAYSAVSYLCSLGHRKIAIVVGNLDLNVYRDRLEGYRRALSERGMTYDRSLVISDLSEDAKSLKDNIKPLFSGANPPDAVFATTDTKAIAVMRGLHDLGLSIPRDVSVVGFDNIRLSELVEPPLTTVAQPLYELGVATFLKLLRQIRAKSEGRKSFPTLEILGTKLIERGSVMRR